MVAEMFIYYLALNPLSARDLMEIPSHRYKRLLFPALAWLLSVSGNTMLLPWVLI